ncbi:hypothetical protein M3Y99_00050600 [Aphelenchoides fujianensis]|nr:hypothetical protein M3Y99_00050600 [Aphelenchoides fujianensis]
MLPPLSAANMLRSLLLLVCALLFVAHAQSFQAPTEIRFQRVARNFPYSMQYMRMLRPAPASVRSAALQWPQRVDTNDELLELIESLEEGKKMSRERRNVGSMHKRYNRYACRFKYCRIFDS